MAKDLWEQLKEDNRPVVLYGMDDAAIKIADKLRSENTEISGVFVSDDFVRDKVFENCKICALKDIEARFEDFIILLCFGSHRTDVIDHIKDISEKHTLLAPDLPVIGEGLFDRSYYEEHKNEYDHLRNLLADDKSKRVLDNVIAYKLTGDLSYLYACESSDEENWSIALPADILVDLGAYTGDTAELYANLNPDYNSIFAFEPEQRNFRKLKEWAQNKSKVFIYNYGIGDKDEIIDFPKGGGRGSKTKKFEKTQFTKLESVWDEIKYKSNLKNENPSFLIKMDLEGWELQAIEGCKNIIKEEHPNLLIAAYHRLGDLIDIAQKVLEINPDYKMYLRHSPCVPAWEINYIFKK